MTQRTHTITDLAEAAFVAIGLHDILGRFAAAALIDDEDATIIDLRPFAGDETCVVCAVEWALHVADDWQSAHRLVLLSSDPRSLRDAREDDIRLFQELRRELESHGFALVDWIQTDGSDIRSLSFTCDVTSGWDAAGSAP